MITSKENARRQDLSPGATGANTRRRKTGFFSHPDYTVGPGVPPDLSLLMEGLAGFTAGQDFPPRGQRIT
jgi:hypothetical protein